MSRAVEEGARAIWEYHRKGKSLPTFERLIPGHQSGLRNEAQAAIAAATPHIRAALFDELIAWAEGSFESYMNGNFYISNDEFYDSVSDWLTRAKNKENTQP